MTTGGIVMLLIRLAGIYLLARVAIWLLPLFIIFLIGEENLGNGIQPFELTSPMIIAGLSNIIIVVAHLLLGLYLLLGGNFIFRLLMYRNPDAVEEAAEQQLVREFVQEAPMSASKVALYQKFLRIHPESSELSAKERHDHFREWATTYSS